jgi:RNA polymerase sigma-70 factor (ECF subfamily)
MNTEQIWQEFKKDLDRFILSKVKNREAAKDILQETFIKIHSCLHQLKDEDKLASWVYQIARNTIHDHFRKQKDILNVNKIEVQQEYFEFGYNEKFMECMLPFIKKLPGKYQEAITLVEIKKQSQVKLAEKLGISYSAVKSRVQRGRVLLKSYFTKCCDISTDKYGNIISHTPKGNCLCEI